jgi:hypothetical protein
VEFKQRDIVHGLRWLEWRASEQRESRNGDPDLQHIVLADLHRSRGHECAGQRHRCYHSHRHVDGHAIDRPQRRIFNADLEFEQRDIVYGVWRLEWGAVEQRQSGHGASYRQHNVLAYL